MEIGTYIDPDLITFLDVDSRKEAIETLVSLAYKKGIVRNKDSFLQTIFKREEMVSTGIGMGIAIPHARLPNYEKFFLIVGISQSGILWDSIDGLPVRLIFLLVGPANQQNEYLKLLSTLTKVLYKEEIRSQLLGSQAPSQVTKFLTCESEQKIV